MEMSMKSIIAILITAFLTLSGCAEHEHFSETYVLKSGRQYYVNDFRIWLVLGAKHSHYNKDKWSQIKYLFTDTHEESGYPYTLLIGSRYTGKLKETAKIFDLKMKVGDQEEIDLLRQHKAVLEIAYDPPTNPLMPGTMEFPLGDQLPFQEGQQVTFTMTFRAPDNKQTQILEYTFEGKTKNHTYTTMDVINSV